ncbi:MAG: hypothetical protein K8S23_03760 [Candidatus Cloacimonetes bacterium]|nr:hypothetical protein [Candidatus Cloacimonadota bacterium]
MKIIKFLLPTIFFLILACSSNNYIKSLGIFHTGINLYECGEKEVRKENREYKNSCNKSETRYIYWEMNFVSGNLSKDLSFPLTAVYHKADSTEFYRNTRDINIKSDWKTSWHDSGWGWDEKGYWEQGKYFIKFYAEGMCLGTVNFEIIDDMNLKYLEQIDSYIQCIKLFESPTESLPRESRIYKNRFPQIRSCYINWELCLQHPLREVDREFEIKSIYYDQNNKIIDSFTHDYHIDKEWSSSFFDGGWGYTESGHWENGKYRIELYVLEELIVSKEFKIY